MGQIGDKLPAGPSSRTLLICACVYAGLVYSVSLGRGPAGVKGHQSAEQVVVHSIFELQYSQSDKCFP